MKILDRYIDQLLETSTPQAPIWNIEKIKEGKASTWNYIDGCMRVEFGHVDHRFHDVNQPAVDDDRIRTKPDKPLYSL